MQNIQARKILGYDDVAAYPPGDSKESLVDIRSCDDSIQTEYHKSDMQPYTNDAMYLRESVAKKLVTIHRRLSKKNLKLKVVYGYRHPEVQENYFRRRHQELARKFPELSATKLDRYTHEFIAAPDVAGHPTGGAVDVTLVDMRGQELDMGTHIADYSDHDKIKTFSSRISPTQMGNRMFLHDLMIDEGFAPFYGEWWHFSYGDKEWAAFYKAKKALYGTLDFKTAS